MTAVHRLIGAEASYYTAKVRAYLRYKRIPFEELLATRKLFQELPVFQDGVRSIPVVLTPEGEALTDSTDIIDTLEARFPGPAVSPPTPLQHLVGLLFELYADEWLLLPAMHYRWSYRAEHYDGLVRDFGATLLPEAPVEEQRRAGEKAAAVFDPVLQMLGITARTVPAIEAWTIEFLTQMHAHLADAPFLLGGGPTLGDFALMGPLYGHLARDAVPARLLRACAPRVLDWVARMNAAPAAGPLLAGDTVPATVVAMLSRVFNEQVPVLVETAQQVCKWVDEHPGDPLPRGVGLHVFTVGGVSERRVLVPYTLSMLQRVLDYRNSLDAAARSRVDGFLDLHGGASLIGLEPRYRVRRERNVLSVDRGPLS